jgi:hypothetical protein
MILGKRIVRYPILYSNKAVIRPLSPQFPEYCNSRIHHSTSFPTGLNKFPDQIWFPLLSQLAYFCDCFLLTVAHDKVFLHGSFTAQNLPVRTLDRTVCKFCLLEHVPYLSTAVSSQRNSLRIPLDASDSCKK